jgi:hypothetical protein
MESFNDIEYNQDELKATKEYVNKQVTVATTIKTSALSNTLKSVNLSSELGLLYANYVNLHFLAFLQVAELYIECYQ